MEVRLDRDQTRNGMIVALQKNDRVFVKMPFVTNSGQTFEDLFRLYFLIYYLIH